MEVRHNVVCPYCGRDTLPDSRYCIHCGQDLSGQEMLKEAESLVDPDITVFSCSSCGAFLPGFARYCNACGRLQRSPAGIEPAPPPAGETDSLKTQQRLLEAVYVRRHGLEPGSEASNRLFPSGWFSGCSELHIKALAEAIAEDRLIRETRTWNTGMIEGVRLKALRINP